MSPSSYPRPNTKRFIVFLRSFFAFASGINSPRGVRRARSPSERERSVSPNTRHAAVRHNCRFGDDRQLPTDAGRGVVGQQFRGVHAADVARPRVRHEHGPRASVGPLPPEDGSRQARRASELAVRDPGPVQGRGTRPPLRRQGGQKGQGERRQVLPEDPVQHGLGPFVEERQLDRPTKDDRVQGEIAEARARRADIVSCTWLPFCSVAQLGLMFGREGVRSGINKAAFLNCFSFTRRKCRI